MKIVLWFFTDSVDMYPCFNGYTDGTTWNGWNNIWVDEETHLKVLDYLAKDYDYNFNLMFKENNFDELQPNKMGLYCYAYGMTCIIID